VEQNDILRHAIDALERLTIPYMLVGSIASTAYGEPRFTQDIDVVVDLTPALIPAFCAAFHAPEFYLSEAAVKDAVQARFQFNVLHPGTGNKLDFILPRTDEWGSVQMQRRQRVQLLQDRAGYAARPEDVIIGKMLYYAEGGSEKHLRDITAILRISGDIVDRNDIQQWATKLGILEVWQAIRERLASNE
jgi:hypothetical protein